MLRWSHELVLDYQILDDYWGGWFGLLLGGIKTPTFDSPEEVKTWVSSNYPNAVLSSTQI